MPPARRSTRPRGPTSPWRQRTADSLVVGSVTRLADGRYDVRFRLWDVVGRADSRRPELPVPQGDLRLASHRIADFVYEKLTGEKGIFSTRIAYVTKGGTPLQPVGGRCRRRERAGRAGQPRADHLAGVVVQRPAAGLRVLRVAQAGGLRAQRGQRPAPRCWRTSAAPTARRPGRPTAITLAVTLSRDGGSQLYTIPRRRRTAPADAEQQHRHRAGVLGRRQHHLLRERPRRRTADLQDGRQRRRPSASPSAAPTTFPRRSAATAGGWPTSRGWAAPSNCT